MPLLLLPNTPAIRHYAQLHRELDEFLKNNSGFAQGQRLLGIQLISAEVHLQYFGYNKSFEKLRATILRADDNAIDHADLTLTLEILPLLEQ